MCPINSTATFQELEQFHNISCTEATSTLVQQALVTYATVNYMKHRQCSYQLMAEKLKMNPFPFFSCKIKHNKDNKHFHTISKNT